MLEQIMPLSNWGVAILASVLTLAVLGIVGLIWIIVLSGRLKRIQKSYTALQYFMDGATLDQQLNEYYNEVKQIKESLNVLEKRVGQTEQKLRVSVDRAEIVRFNAFDNMGSDLSFALALLNQQGDGVVLSSINNREESRVYAKPIAQGESTYHLSTEEKEVISKAKETVKV